MTSNSASGNGVCRRLSAKSKPQGTTTVENLLDSDDISYMLGALEALGVGLECDAASGRCLITGNGGPLDAPDGP